jgi:hypothetical protein
MQNPLAIHEVSKATRFELDKRAHAYQLLNEASRETEPEESRVRRARVFLSEALIRVGLRISPKEMIP